MGKVRPIGEEDREELRIRQQALQNQFLAMQDAAGVPARPGTPPRRSG